MLDTWVNSYEIADQSPGCTIVSGGFKIEPENLQKYSDDVAQSSSWFCESLAAIEPVQSVPTHVGISQQKFCQFVLDMF